MLQPAAPKFNPGASGTGRGNTSGHSFFPQKDCFECRSTTHFRHNCPQLRSKTVPKPEANVKRVSVRILHLKSNVLLRLCVNRVVLIMILRHCMTLLCQSLNADKVELEFKSVNVERERELKVI